MNEPALVDRIPNDPRKYSEAWPNSWCVQLSVILGAYRCGKMHEWLSDGLGLRWNLAVNLCPPGLFNPELARRFVPHLRSYVEAAPTVVSYVLIGGEVAKAFGIEDPYAPCAYTKGGQLLVLPASPTEGITKETTATWVARHCPPKPGI